MDTIYISCHGTSIYTLLGYMERHAIDCKKYATWYCFGSSVLVPFLKFLGKTYFEIFGMLSHEDFDFLQLLVPGRSIASKPQEKVKNNIRETISDIMKQHVSQTQFENLERFYDMTGCDINVSIWDEKNKRHVFINRHNFKGEVLEVIMIALCCSSYYYDYEIIDHVFSDSSWVVHPFDFFMKSSQKSLGLFCMYSFVDDDVITAFTSQEKAIMKQFINYNNYKFVSNDYEKGEILKKLVKVESPLNYNCLKTTGKKNLYSTYM